MKKRDEYKRDLAIKNGFTFIEVFDTDDMNEKIKLILDTIHIKENNENR